MITYRMKDGADTTVDVSIICVYNQQEIIDQYLLASLKVQDLSFEKILIDNRKNEFKSAATALNYGNTIAKGKFLIFVHQDIEFLKENQLSNIVRFLVDNPKSIVGSAGVKIGCKGVYTTMLNDADKHLAGDNDINRPKQVDVLDECIIACTKETFDELKFDEDICNGWDLYAVELCMRHRLRNGEVYVLPSDIWHVSPGNPKHDFYKCARRICKMYRHKMKKFQSCCVTIPVTLNWTSSIVLSLLEILHLIRR